MTLNSEEKKMDETDINETNQILVDFNRLLYKSIINGVWKNTKMIASHIYLFKDVCYKFK